MCWQLCVFLTTVLLYFPLTINGGDHSPIYTLQTGLAKLVSSNDEQIRTNFVTRLYEELYPHMAAGSLFDLVAAAVPNNESTSSCLTDIGSILWNIRQRKVSGLQWLDAIGRPPPGLSLGAAHWPGSFQLCMSIPEHILPANTTMPSRYCTVMFKLPTPIEPPKFVHLGVEIGVCIPRSCSEEQFFAILNALISRTPFELEKVASYCHSSPEAIAKDSWFWATIVVLLCFAVPMLVATGLELFIWYQWRSRKLKHWRELFVTISSGTDDSEYHSTDSSDQDVMLLDPETEVYPNYTEFRKSYFKDKGLPLGLLGAFSLPWNSWKWWTASAAHLVTSTGRRIPHPLNFLDGIRVITMLWIIFGHCVAFSTFVTNNIFGYAQENARRFSFQALVGATVSVDVFFMMSGLLGVYTTLPRFRTVQGLVAQARFWAMFIFHRLLRLTPAYVLTILIYAGLFHHLYDGPLYPQKPEMTDAMFCRSHGWATYLNNFIYADQLCMGWSWYLANEFQFSVVLAPIFISLTHWYPIAGIVFAVGLIVSCILCTFAVAYSNNYLPGVLSFPEIFPTLYIKPYHRWATYAIGLILGWILLERHRLPKRWSGSRILIFTLISLGFASVFCISTVYGLYGYVSQTIPLPSTGVSALFTSVHRSVFVLGIAIVCYLCAFGYATPIRSLLAWPGFRPFARLSYGAYLIHILVIIFLCLGRQSPVLLDNLFLISLLFAVYPISYCLAYLLSMATESPILEVEKLFGLR